MAAQPYTATFTVSLEFDSPDGGALAVHEKLNQVYSAVYGVAAVRNVEFDKIKVAVFDGNKKHDATPETVDQFGKAREVEADQPAEG